MELEHKPTKFGKAEGGNRDSSRKSVSCHVWLPTTTFHEAKDLADKNNLSLSRQVSILVQKGLRK